MRCNIVNQDYLNKEKNGGMVNIISNPTLNTKPYNPWITKIQNIFRQICRTVSWLHSKGIAHLDLSLENTLLFDENGELIKLIDFGVSHDINNINNNGSWINNKRIGKTAYMAPEVWAQKDYDCRKADVWTLGVMLFMMLIGCPPYNRPIIKRHNKDSKGDAALSFLINGKIDIILNAWNRSWMVSDDAKDLLIHIFKIENQRINMNQVLSHPFVGLRLNCDGNLNVDQCPHVLRTINVLIQHNQGLLNEYDFGTVRLLRVWVRQLVENRKFATL